MTRRTQSSCQPLKRLSLCGGCVSRSSTTTINDDGDDDDDDNVRRRILGELFHDLAVNLVAQFTM